MDSALSVDDKRQQQSWAYDVFVSYNPRDAAWVWEWFVPRLKQARLAVAIDGETFQPGAPLLEEVERCIATSRKTVVILSPEWVSDQWRAFESLLVQHEDPGARFRQLIPVLVQPCTPPKRIQLLHWIDFTDPARQERQLHRLVEAIQGSADLPELHPELAVPDAVQRTWEMRWLWAMAAVTLATLALLGWWVWSQRPPERMDPEKYGIAIAEFSVIDRDKPSSNNDLGLLMARRIAGFLEYEEAELAETIGAPVQVWGAERPVEPVQEPADVERASAIGADVLVYGSVRYTEGIWQIEPRFYLSDQVIGTASELTGEYALGTPIRFTPGNTASEADLTIAMRARLRALTQLLMGLSHYSGGTTSSYQKAAAVFQAAAQETEWGAAVEKSGQEVLYLFLGNAWLKLGSLTDDPSSRAEFFAESKRAYQTALQYNPAYARVYNGLGDLYFQHALLVDEERDDCAEDWDWDLLDQSTAAYTQALALHQETALPSGNVDLRAQLGLGRALYFQGLCLSSEIEPNEWLQAQEHHRAVLIAYKAEPSPHLRFLAAMAQLDLADMAFKQADWRLYEDPLDEQGLELLNDASRYYRDALGLLPPPLTEEELRLAINIEGKLLATLCWQQKPDEMQTSLTDFLQANHVSEEMEQVLREIQQGCGEQP